MRNKTKARGEGESEGVGAAIWAQEGRPKTDRVGRKFVVYIRWDESHRRDLSGGLSRFDLHFPSISDGIRKVGRQESRGEWYQQRRSRMDSSRCFT